MRTTTSLALLLLSWVFVPPSASADDGEEYSPWKHAGRFYVLTTEQGAALPAATMVNEFPLLVRLHSEFFDFSQAQAEGADLRFSTEAGIPLPYEIESWDAEAGVASVWVRVPRIEGNSRQLLRMYWGNEAASPESDGRAVFSPSNGYLSVWHLGSNVQDTVGTVESTDMGTTSIAGVIGSGRRFAEGKGIFGGDSIVGYPTGASAHSSEAWFRAERPNGRMIAWGNEEGQGKSVMMFQSPPHIRMDCYFSDGNVASESRLSMGQWTHVVHTYESGRSKLYINGMLDGSAEHSGAPLNIKSPARLWLGGWYGRFDYVGDLDEVRISRVARSSEWVRLQYENQQRFQTLVGPLVPSGSEFSVSATQVTLDEGESTTLTAKAGGAQKIYWILQDDSGERIVAVDRLSFTLAAGRVAGGQTRTLVFKAIYPDGERVQAVSVTVNEAIPEPVFQLAAPSQWDGRETIEVVPQLTNLAEMRAAGADNLKTEWHVSPLAVISETSDGRLILKRAQQSGPLTVTATISNGGEPVSQSTILEVTEPAHDPWVMRTPTNDEKPEENQFYARDENDEGTLHYNGTLDAPADVVYLKVYADGQLYDSATQQLAADHSYAFAMKLKAALVRYSIEFGTKQGDRETALDRVGNLVCGDAFLITGQSNAVATDFGREDPEFHSPWIRTFGSMSGSPDCLHLWGEATHRNRDGEKLQIGYWGMELGRQLVAQHRVPICILNGAVGGTRIDQHQRNHAQPVDTTTIYGRLLWRAREARLTHGIRGIFWHQGENDQGADGPSGGYGWETYRQLFIELAASWKTDFPNLQHYYVFQIWPKSCSMGINGSDNRLREVQRNLPSAFSRLSLMSTLGIDPPGGCHFPAAGYAEFARLILPLVQRDLYGQKFPAPVTPPNLRNAWFTSATRDEIALQFDQEVVWNDPLLSEFTLAGESQSFVAGAASGDTLTLRLAAPTTSQRLTYLDSKSWSQERLLRGRNGLAALTFCEVNVAERRP